MEFLVQGSQFSVAVDRGSQRTRGACTASPLPWLVTVKNEVVFELGGLIEDALEEHPILDKRVVRKELRLVSDP
jgi:hypothetical protein